MGFVAAQAVEALTYDFSPHGPSGEIVEPSTAQIEAYRAAYFEILKANADATEGVDQKDKTLSEYLATVDMDAIMERNREAEAQVIAATADVTGLDAEMLAALPARFKSAFLGWVVGVFLSPEA